MLTIQAEPRSPSLLKALSALYDGGDLHDGAEKIRAVFQEGPVTCQTFREAGIKPNGNEFGVVVNGISLRVYQQ